MPGSPTSPRAAASGSRPPSVSARSCCSRSSCSQAKHFQLLTGNYSKELFFHPGPAFLYIMAFGEAVFHEALHLVPTPWNGQLIAILLLTSAVIGATLAVIARHANSVRVVLICVAVALAFISVHPLTVNSAWFPCIYFAPALFMLVSTASVPSGRWRPQRRGRASGRRGRRRGRPAAAGQSE